MKPNALRAALKIAASACQKAKQQHAFNANCYLTYGMAECKADADKYLEYDQSIDLIFALLNIVDQLAELLPEHLPAAPFKH